MLGRFRQVSGFKSSFKIDFYRCCWRIKQSSRNLRSDSNRWDAARCLHLLMGNSRVRGLTTEMHLNFPSFKAFLAWSPPPGVFLNWLLWIYKVKIVPCRFDHISSYFRAISYLSSMAGSLGNTIKANMPTNLAEWVDLLKQTKGPPTKRCWLFWYFLQ